MRRREGERVRGRWKVGGEGGGEAQSHLMYLPLSKHMPKSSEQAREYGEAGRESEEKHEEEQN